MDSRLKEILSILSDVGAVVVRQRKHQVYRLPSGETFVVAATPSDGQHAYANALGDLKRRLGLYGERGVKGERREKKRREAPAALTMPTPLSGHKAALSNFREQLGALPRAIPPAPAVPRGKRIVHPVFGSHPRKAPEARPVDLTPLLTSFSRKTR